MTTDSRLSEKSAECEVWRENFLPGDSEVSIQTSVATFIQDKSLEGTIHALRSQRERTCAYTWKGGRKSFNRFKRLKLSPLISCILWWHDDTQNYLPMGPWLQWEINLEMITSIKSSIIFKPRKCQTKIYKWIIGSEIQDYSIFYMIHQIPTHHCKINATQL